MDTDCDEFETEIETSGKRFSLCENFKTAAGQLSDRLKNFCWSEKKFVGQKK